ncbi:SlyX family protein [Geomonas silvestris]|nr:SlyX family protein [Geomonas silvestris]
MPSDQVRVRVEEIQMEQRLTDMEMLIMHQGHVIEQLNEVVTAQQNSIDRLMLDVKIIKDHLRGMQASELRPLSEEEPPPHY